MEISVLYQNPKRCLAVKLHSRLLEWIGLHFYSCIVRFIMISGCDASCGNTTVISVIVCI